MCGFVVAPRTLFHFLKRFSVHILCVFAVAPRTTCTQASVKPCKICAMNVFGGDEGDRTPYPLLARQVLSQMSYTPTVLEDNEVITLYPLSSLRNKPQKLNNDNTSALNIG